MTIGSIAIIIHIPLATLIAFRATISITTSFFIFTTVINTCIPRVTALIARTHLPVSATNCCTSFATTLIITAFITATFRLTIRMLYTYWATLYATRGVIVGPANFINESITA